MDSKLSSDHTPARPWREVVQAKRAEREVHISKHEADSSSAAKAVDLLSPGGTPIVSVQQVTDLLAKGDITAEDLTRAYIAK